MATQLNRVYVQTIDSTATTDPTLLLGTKPVTTSVQVGGLGTGSNQLLFNSTGINVSGPLNASRMTLQNASITNLGVTGQTTLENVSINGTLRVNGQITINNVSATTLSISTLSVANNANVSGNVTIAGSLLGLSSLTLPTLTTTTNTVMANASVLGTLKVAQETTLQNTSVNGTLRVDGSTTVNGATTFNNSVSINANTLTISVGGGLKTNDIQGILNTGPHSLFSNKQTGALTVFSAGSATLDVAGAGIKTTAIQGILDTGPHTLYSNKTDGDLTVLAVGSGTMTVNGNGIKVNKMTSTTTSGSLAIAGDQVAGGSVSIGTANTATTVGGTLGVTGKSTLGLVDIIGVTNINGVGSTNTGTITIGNSTTGGTTTLASPTVNINNAGTGTTTIGSGNSGTLVSGNCSMSRTLAVVGNCSFNNVSMTGAVNINTGGSAVTTIGSGSSATTVGGSLTVTGNETVTGTLGVTGATTLGVTGTGALTATSISTNAISGTAKLLINETSNFDTAINASTTGNQDVTIGTAAYTTQYLRGKTININELGSGNTVIGNSTGGITTLASTTIHVRGNVSIGSGTGNPLSITNSRSVISLKTPNNAVVGKNSVIGFGSGGGSDSDTFPDTKTEGGTEFSARIKAVTAGQYGTQSDLFFQAKETSEWLGSTHGNYRNIMTLQHTGYIGIGTTVPQFPLHIESTRAPAFEIGTHWRVGTGTGQDGYKTFTSDTNTQWYNIAVRVTTNISATGFVMYSDRRIKENIVDVQDDSALVMFRKLKPTTYRYKDFIERGTETVYGFIAQEVKEVIPYSSILSKEAVPNVYELAAFSTDTLTLTSNTSDLSRDVSGALFTKLKVKTRQGKDEFVNIVEVIDDHRVKVDKDLTDWGGQIDASGQLVPGDKIFVYGQEVNDFHTLNKDAIWTVATAALQEVDRQLQAEKQKVSALQTALDALLARVESLEQKTST